MKNSKNLWVAIVVGVAFVLASVVLSIAYYKVRVPEKTISVVGLAERDFTSDLIVWDLYFSVKKMNMKEAYSAIKEQTEKVKEYLFTKGVTENEMIFDAISSYEDTRYEWIGDRQKSFFDGFVLTQRVKVTSKEVEKIEKIARESTELIDLDIHLTSLSPDYYYTKLADLKIEMLAQASEDAHKRAETVTLNAGAFLGKLKSANMGVFQITAPNSSDEEYTWGGTFNTSSKIKRASINMRLTYLIE